MYERIYAQVRLVPFGKIASYGQIAQACGLFRGARIVGWALRALPVSVTDVPWQRIVNRKGVISIVNPQAPPNLQKQLLEEEGIKVSEVAGYLQVDSAAWWYPITEPLS